jgi:hypothetical protein
MGTRRPLIRITLHVNSDLLSVFHQAQPNSGSHCPARGLCVQVKELLHAAGMRSVPNRKDLKPGVGIFPQTIEKVLKKLKETNGLTITPESLTEKHHHQYGRYVSLNASVYCFRNLPSTNKVRRRHLEPWFVVS